MSPILRIESVPSMIEEIINKSTPTGSRLFGGFTDDSDYDYIVHRSVFAICWDVLPYVAYERLAYNSKEMISYLFEFEGKKINLLIARPGHYHRWINATKMMKEFFDDGIVYTNKKDRVQAFQMFKGR